MELARDFLGTFVANGPFCSRNFPFYSLSQLLARPLSARICLENLERAMGIEPTTYSLGSCRSTTELRPPTLKSKSYANAAISVLAPFLALISVPLGSIAGRLGISKGNKVTALARINAHGQIRDSGISAWLMASGKAKFRVRACWWLPKRSILLALDDMFLSHENGPRFGGVLFYG